MWIVRVTDWNPWSEMKLFNPADPYGVAVGHTGGNFGYVSWAGCLPEEGAVIVVLSDREFDDIGGMARPLVDAVIAD